MRATSEWQRDARRLGQALVLVFALTSSLCSCSTHRVNHDARLERILADPEAWSISFREAFQVDGLLLVCNLDEFTHGSNGVRYLRSQGKIPDVRYVGTASPIPEGMVGFLVVTSEQADLRLVDRRRMNFPASRCYDAAERFERDSNGGWTITGDSFPA